MKEEKDNLFKDNELTDFIEELGENHSSASNETPIREDAFDLDDDLKIELIQKHFKEIMEILGLDLTDDSLKGTPARVAKMYVREIFKGLNPENKPAISLFENKFMYNNMLVEKNITVQSHCEHHFLPIEGKAHVAYISTGQIIGLSKINRIVDYYSKRPQVQERLTRQIANEMKKVLQTEDVAVVIDAHHMCVSSRGIEDMGSRTVTADYSGQFKDKHTKQEFLKYIEIGGHI